MVGSVEVLGKMNQIASLCAMKFVCSDVDDKTRTFLLNSDSCVIILFPF